MAITAVSNVTFVSNHGKRCHEKKISSCRMGIRTVSLSGAKSLSFGKHAIRARNHVGVVRSVDFESVEYVDPTDVGVDKEPPPEPMYKLKFLWLEKNIAVCADQILKKDNYSPMTEYFFWPRKDAWEELKEALEAKPWVSERDAVLLLNRTTEVINFWQEEGVKHSLSEAREKFPDCEFIGS